jgi:cyclophilin family peptidyl-prolyl cis-trans isomerase/HEAT repeat protein
VLARRSPRAVLVVLAFSLSAAHASLAIAAAAPPAHPPAPIKTPAPAGTPPKPVTHPRPPDPHADPMHAIALAEDQRRGSDGVLAGYLEHTEPAVRARAALAVGRLQDSTAVPALIPRLKDTSIEVRREAAFALGQIGHRSAREALERQLDDPDTELRQLALEALGKLGDKAATLRVAKFLSDANPALRGTAAVALWRLADSTAINLLIARTEDPDPGVRWRVLWALEKIVSPNVIVLRAALRIEDPDPLVRSFAARTIGRQKAPRGSVYLLGALDDPDVGVVVNAIRGLQMIADTTCSTCGTALEHGLTHAHPYVRYSAATALGDRFAWVRLDSTGTRRLRDALFGRLHDSDAATRGASAKALLARFGADAIADVEPVLADTSMVARVAALDGLKDVTGSPKAAERLRASLSPSHALLERMTAAEALGERHDAQASKLLRAGLSDTTLLYVASCVTGLASAGDSASVPLLLKTYRAHARDGEPDVRLAIQDALKTLRRTSIADSLERASPGRLRFPSPDSTLLGQPATEKGAVLHTSKGDIEWAFYGGDAPETVRNFVRLARRGWFDGDVFHRVVPNFVIQDGDPTGTGSGGPGYTIRCEYNRLHYEAGQVGMALSGKDTGGSQWFITHSPQLHLDGRYTIFARVVRGMDVVQHVTQGDRILSVEILK